MYRVTVNGIDYSAPDLPTLQQWVQEGRLLPDTFVWVEAMQQHVKATEVPGLIFPNMGNPHNYATPPQGTAAYQRPGAGYGTYQKVDNNLFLAIFSAICCGCLPLGIVAIVYAAQVDGLASRGETQKAMDSAKKAQTWAIASIICGLIFGGIRVALMAGDFR